MTGYDGHSGSIMLHAWLRQHAVETVGKLKSEMSWTEAMAVDWTSVVQTKYV